jgi:hypothetical protein
VKFSQKVNGIWPKIAYMGSQFEHTFEYTLIHKDQKLIFAHVSGTDLAFCWLGHTF